MADIVVIPEAAHYIVMDVAGGGGAGQDGNGIVSITQPSDFVLRIETNDFTEDFELFQGAKGDKGDKGDTGNTGATGATGPSSLEPFIDAPEELEHFTGYRATDLSLVFGSFTNSGGTVTQLASSNGVFKSVSALRLSVNNSGANSLALLRKSSIFNPTYNPVNNEFDFEIGFTVPQLPTSAQNFHLEVSAVSTALNTAFSNAVAGIAGRIEFNASAGRAAFVLETRNASVSSTAIAATTVVINTAYKMRIRLNQPAGTAQLLVNGTVVATLSTNLPNVLLMKRILMIKITGTGGGTETADIDYHYDKIRFL